MSSTEVTPAATTAAIPPAAAAAPPAAHKSTALWVGDLAPTVSESHLENTFRLIGPVVATRVCRDSQTRESLGYGYVNMASHADAEKAIRELNYTSIEGRPCRIMWSQRDPTVRRSNIGNVFVKNLPLDVKLNEFHEIFSRFGGILSCKIALDSNGNSKGYGFIHFDSEEAAKEAIQFISGTVVGGRELQAMPFIPRTQRSGPEWTNVFIKNVPKHFTDKELTELFAVYGEIVSAVVMLDNESKSKGFGFVSYKSHHAAVAATDALNGKEIDGELVSPPRPKVKKTKEGETEPEIAAAVSPIGDKKCRLYVGRALKKTDRERAQREAAENARREKAAKWHNCNLYVRNLAETVDEELLRKEFTPFGTITSVRIEKDSQGRSRLFGYVCYSSAEEAGRALSVMHRKLVANKPLHVCLWQSKEQRQVTLSLQQQQQAQQQQRTAGARGAGLGAQGAFLNANNMAGGWAGAANPQMAAILANPMMMMSLFMQQAAQKGATGFTPQQLQQFAVAMAQQQQIAMASVGRNNNGNMNNNNNNMNNNNNNNNRVMGNHQQNAQNVSMIFNQLNAQQQQQGQQMNNRNQRNNNNNNNNANKQGSNNNNASRPQAAAVVAGNARVQQQTNKPVAKTAAAATNGQKPVQYRDEVRNLDTGASATAATSTIAGNVSEKFTATLAAASPEQRTQMLGEQLYQQVLSRNVTNAPKITGMILQAMGVDQSSSSQGDVSSELLNLLEDPAQLNSIIDDAVETLRKAQTE